MKRLKSFKAAILLGLAVSLIFLLSVWLPIAAGRQALLDTSLLAALGRGEVEDVKFLLEQGADPNARDLSHVKSEGPLQQLLALITRSHSPEFDRAPAALSYATDRSEAGNTTEHAVMVKLLLDHGANVKLCEHCDPPLLLLAVQWGGIETVRLLLDHGADANIRSSDGTSALHESIEHCNPALVQLLLEHKAQVQMQKGKDGLNDFDKAQEMAHNDPDYASHYIQILTLLKNASNTH